MNANNQRKIKKRKHYANIIQGCETTVNDNKEDLRQKSCCLPQID
jgi:hypothetical protein